MEVSQVALERAAAAVYGRNSFRGSGALGRDHHFEPGSGGRRVCERVRRQVRFRHGNLLAPPFVPGRDRFDVIFCRNLLIYFDRPTQDRVIDGLGALLKPDGLLFVGSSEGGLALSHGYVSAKLPMAFAFRRAQPARPPRAVPARPPVMPQSRPQPVAPAVPSESPELSAGVFCRFGLEHVAQGHVDEAEAFFRKALYLDPRHEEAVTQLALLVERRGGHAEAKVLWSRARRLAAGGAR
jgi:chemotaxis protein methyltransferase WspC